MNRTMTALGTSISRRQVVGGMLAAALAAPIVASRTNGVAFAEGSEVADGTYTASAQAMNDLLEVTVTIADGKIADVVVAPNSETPGIGGQLLDKTGAVADSIGKAPVDLLPELIVANNSLAVDMVTGATITSATLISLVEDCIKQAGGDPADFRTPIDYPAYPDTDADVVVVGGGATGVETAEFIGEIGTLSAEELRFMMIFEAEPVEKIKELLNHGVKNVSVVEMQPKFALDINPGCRWSIMKRVRQLGIELLGETKVVSITKAGVVVQNADGERILPADTVVMAAGAKHNTDMYEQLKEHFEHVDLIGDAVKVAKIPDAISSGYYLGISF